MIKNDLKINEFVENYLSENSAKEKFVPGKTLIPQLFFTIISDIHPG